VDSVPKKNNDYNAIIFVVVDDDDNEDYAVQVSSDTAFGVHLVGERFDSRPGHQFSEGFNGLPQFL
jgi:hypothetical protein